jgi:acyl carrier protein
MQVATRIREFLITEFSFTDPKLLTVETRLLGGPIDSLGLMQLVAFVEDEFGITFDYGDLTAEHFGTIGDIEALVLAKQRDARAS